MGLTAKTPLHQFSVPNSCVGISPMTSISDTAAHLASTDAADRAEDNEIGSATTSSCEWKLQCSAPTMGPFQVEIKTFSFLGISTSPQKLCYAVPMSLTFKGHDADGGCVQCPSTGISMPSVLCVLCCRYVWIKLFFKRSLKTLNIYFQKHRGNPFNLSIFPFLLFTQPQVRWYPGDHRYLSPRVDRIVMLSDAHVPFHSLGFKDVAAMCPIYLN